LSFFPSPFRKRSVPSWGKSASIARNYKSGKIPFTLRKADGPTLVIALPLSTATFSSMKAFALIQERYATKIGQYQISIQEK
jgi:hypothetical protein